MTTLRFRRGITRILATAVAAGALTVASPWGADAASDLLGGHGRFEHPSAPHDGCNKYVRRDTNGVLDTWTVRSGSVFLVRGCASLIEPAQGNQFLVLGTPAAGNTADTAICREVPTLAGHHYGVTLQAASIFAASSVFTMSLGAASKAVRVQGGAIPNEWHRVSARFTADTANTTLCVGARRSSQATQFPAIDAVRMTALD